MINFARRVMLAQPHSNTVVMIASLSLLVAVSQAAMCSQMIIQNSTGKNCEFYYSYECTNSTKIIFNYCAYDACSNQNQSKPCSEITQMQSVNFTICTNVCMSSVAQEEAGKNWLATVLIVVGVFLIFVVCGCIARNLCKAQLPDRNRFIIQMRPPSVEENEIDSERRLSTLYNLEIQLKWMELPPNANWISQEESCAICLQKQLNCCLPCHHYYHANCIKEWLKLKSFCPTCKAENFDQAKIRCKKCKLKEMICHVEQLKRMDLQQTCPSCI